MYLRILYLIIYYYDSNKNVNRGVWKAHLNDENVVPSWKQTFLKNNNPHSLEDEN